MSAILTCFALPFGFTLLLAISGWRLGPASIAKLFVSYLPAVLVIGLPIAAIAMYLFALPLAVFFRARGWLGVVPVCIADTIVGALVFPGSFWLLNDEVFKPGDMPFGACNGFAAGLIFCLIAGIPWRSAPPKVLISNT